MRPSYIKIIYILNTLLLVGISSATFAQDVIFLRNGKELIVTIDKIGNDMVQYYLDRDSTVTYSLNKALIESIERDANIRLTKKKKLLSTNRQQVKFDFVSFLNKSLILSYERMINHYSSIQTNIDLYNQNDNKGFEIGGDYRIYFKRSSLKNKVDVNLFKGYYTFVRLHYGYQNRRFFNFRPVTFTTETGNRKSHIFISGLGLGKQWQYEKFTCDINLGYLYFNGWSKEELEIGSPTTVPLIEYDKGIFRGRNNKGININFALGYQF